MNLHNTKWYLDSGCSRHMTGDKNLLSEIKNSVKENVTFCDDAKGKSLVYVTFLSSIVI